MREKILIANSVGRDEAGNNYILFPSRWTASVGKVKSFEFYPYELAYLSSVLKRDGELDVKMVDGNLEGLNWRQYFRRYESERPDYLVMESSSVVYGDDLKFALEFKKKYGTKLIFCGQHATAFPAELVRDGVDYVCLGEYEYTVWDIVRGVDRRKIRGLYPNERRELLDVKTLPYPEDDDISRLSYTRIGGCDYKEIEFFASRGCMMNCIFCVARQVYYGKPNWRQREVMSIVEEIALLRKKYPEMEGIFFDEENHNTSREFILKLTEAIVAKGLSDLKYDAMCGYWTLDEQVLRAMKGAGYYKIRIGVESVSKRACRGMRKNIEVEKLVKTLKLAKRIGLRMYGTFTFGVPGSTLKDDRLTLKFLEKLLDKNLLYDFQASVCTPQPGTPFFDYLDSKGYLLTRDWKQYNGSTAVYEYPNYSKKEIESNMSTAYRLYLRTMIRRKGYVGVVRGELGKVGLWGTIRKAINLLAQSTIFSQKVVDSKV